MKEMVNAVIFDMDGVILDNNDWHLKSWLAYAKTRAIPLQADEAFTRVFGKTNREIILEAYPDCDENTIQTWSLEKEALYREMYRPHFRLAEGLLPFLEKLKEQGISMGLASNAPLENIEFTLESGGIKDFFRAVVWAGMVEHPKPHPDIYLKASSMIGIPASQCLVIEDSPTGLKAAVAAGCIPMGITSTYRREDLARHTSLISGNFPEISNYLFHTGS